MSLFDQRNVRPRIDRLTIVSAAMLAWVVVAATAFMILAPHQF